MSIDIIIHTEVEDVTLRLLTTKDAEEFFDLTDRNRAHIAQFDLRFGELAPDLETTRLILRHPPADREFYGIWKHTSLVGLCVLTLKGETPQTEGQVPTPIAEISYWVSQDHLGQKLGTIAARALTDYGLELRMFRSMFGVTHAKNYRSQHVLSQAGYHLESKNPDECLFRKHLLVGAA